MKAISIFFFIAVAISGFSQKCSDFYFLQKDKTVVMTITNKKGKVVGKQTYTISDVKGSGNSISSTVRSVFTDQKGKLIAKGVNNMQCKNGQLMMDLKMLIPSGQQQQMGESSASVTTYMEYPSSMAVDDSLKNASFSMDFKSPAGIAGHVEINITNRKVVGKETITNSAGSWNCFKITYHSKMNFKVLIGFNVNTDVTEWYAPGFGVVKTEMDNGGKTEITSIK
jgi:hypothetical protein